MAAVCTAVVSIVPVAVAPLVSAGDTTRGDTPSPTATAGTSTGPIEGEQQLLAAQDRLGGDWSPLLRADAADPFVAIDGTKHWLFTTNNGAGNVPAITGHHHAIVTHDALPVLPEWATPGSTWAPALTSTGDHWVLAFTARHRTSGRQCIGVATSPTIGGPYSPADIPLVCDIAQGGAIDPSFVVDATGQRWLLYKSDGNCCSLPTTLHSVPLTPDASTLTGPPTTLLGADQPWEGDLVEAPTMRQVGERWLLLYSANRWNSPDYAVGAAWCTTPAGPCHKQPNSVLTRCVGIDGPGGVEFVPRSSTYGVAVAFHAWPQDDIGYQTGATRRLRLGHIDVSGDTVTITCAEDGAT